LVELIATIELIGFFNHKAGMKGVSMNYPGFDRNSDMMIVPLEVSMNSGVIQL